MGNQKSKEVRQIIFDLQQIEIGLRETVSTDKFENYANLAIGISEVLEKYEVSQGLVERIVDLKSKGLGDVKKKHYLSKIFNILSPKVDYIRDKEERDNPPFKDELFYSYESKGFRNSSMERLEALKLQLDLVKQKGFYLMQSKKSKVKTQEDILIITAQIIQELSFETSLVPQVISKFQSIKEYENLPEVTDIEESVIAECYQLLFECLLDLNYR